MKKKLTIIAIIAVLVVAFMCPLAAQAIDGNYTVTIKSYNASGSMITIRTAFIPCGGNTLDCSYVWDAANYRFNLVSTLNGSTYSSISNYAINYRNMNGTSFTYTTPNSGNGSSTKYLFGSGITSAQKNLTCEVVAGGSVIGSFVVATGNTTYGKKTINASSYETEITGIFAGSAYEVPANLAQTKQYEFTYTGCSKVQFSYDGTATTPAPTAPGGGSSTPTPTVDPEATCKLKIYGVESGSAAGSPTYNNPYITYVRPGETYRFDDPAEYGILPATGYEYDYYTANGSEHRTIGYNTYYIPSGYSGLSVVVYFKQKTVANTFNVQFVKADNSNVGSPIAIPANGNYNATMTIDATTLTLPEGYQLAPATAQTYTNKSYVYTGIYGAPTTVKFVVEKIPATAPAVSESEGTLVLTTPADKDRIDTIIFAKGTYTTLSALLEADYYEYAGEDLPDSGILCSAAILESLGGNGTYTIYIKDTDNNAFFTTLEVTTSIVPPTPAPILPLLSVEGNLVMLENDEEEVEKFGRSYGHFTTLADMNDAGIRYHSSSRRFEADRNGEITLYIIMSDGNEYFRYVTVDYYKTPGIEAEGFTVYAVENKDQITRFGYALGTYADYAEFYPNARFASTSKEFTATEPGVYTVYIVMQDGGEHMLTITLAEVVPTIVVEDLLVYVDDNASDVVKFGYVLGSYSNYEDFVAATPRYASTSKQFTAPSSGTYTIYCKMTTGLEYFFVRTITGAYTDINVGDEIIVTPIEEEGAFIGRWLVEISDEFKGNVTRFGTAYGTHSTYADFSVAGDMRMASTSKQRTLKLAGDYTVYLKTDDGVMHFVPITIDHVANITINLTVTGSTVYATANGAVSSDATSFQYVAGNYTYETFPSDTASSGKTNMRAAVNGVARPYGEYTIKIILTTGEIFMFNVDIQVANAGLSVQPTLVG